MRGGALFWMLALARQRLELGAAAQPQLAEQGVPSVYGAGDTDRASLTAPTPTSKPVYLDRKRGRRPRALNPSQCTHHRNLMMALLVNSITECFLSAAGCLGPWVRGPAPLACLPTCLHLGWEK